MSATSLRPLYSFVVDEGPLFPYQAWHLAHSLVHFCGAEPSDIHIQCTAAADPHAREIFNQAGFTTHTLNRFGDGRYCNKIAQFENLTDQPNEILVLLDTDTIAVSDLRNWVDPRCIVAKTVDAPNPPIETLKEIAAAAGLAVPGAICLTDDGRGHTYMGNCNGGMYAIPRRYSENFAREWRHWALWLLDNIEPLRRLDRSQHVDQVGFWLALLSTALPYRPIASNANYFVHMNAEHRYFDDASDIALLHYHRKLNVVGLIEPDLPLSDAAQTAVALANAQISRNFQNALFWTYRYQTFPDRGSGIGSRGANCLYKRDLLREQGIEEATSILDVGCGDLEVIGPLRLQDYTGLDVSPAAIERGPSVLPNGKFRLGLPEDTPKADFVLCLEVLIHQPTFRDYVSLIQFIAERTERVLLVSGYAINSDAVAKNAMVHFHEPLLESLNRTGKFSRIIEVGAHTDVRIYRCDV